MELSLMNICWCRVLWYIGENPGAYGRKIYKKTDITYTHISKIIKALEAEGYIERVYPTGLENRTKYWKATPKGKVAMEALEVLENLLHE